MPDDVSVQPHKDGAVIDVHAQPRASRSEVIGAHDGALRVRITAAPVDGAANEAIVSLLSGFLGVRKSDVEVIGGASGRRKRVYVRGLSPDEVRLRLQDR